MNLQTYSKQPTETLDYTLDYSEWLNKSDMITSSVISSSPEGLSISKIASDKAITLIVGGGVNDILYKISSVTTTYNGLVKEDEFKIRVREL